MLDGGEIWLALPATGEVALKIYDVKGQLVETLIDRRVEAGGHEIQWHGTNSRGNKVTPGIYFLRLDTGSGTVAKKVVVSK
jgi:flagellar hook assembly protein FlgD